LLVVALGIDHQQLTTSVRSTIDKITTVAYQFSTARVDELDRSAVNAGQTSLVLLEQNLIPSPLGNAPPRRRSTMASGTIKRLVRDRGFGFIRDDGGQEWFFHRSSVQGSFDQLNEGQRVSFDEEPSAKGPRAGNVRSE
jgi:CspA family cold shock protein